MIIRNYINLKFFFLLFTLNISFMFAQISSLDCDSSYVRWNRSITKIIGGDDVTTPVNGHRGFFDLIQYPDSAQTNKIEGTVIVWFIVDTNGITKCHKVLKSLGYGCDEQVINALKQTKFNPVLVRGKAIETAQSFSVHFRLKDDKKNFIKRVNHWLKTIFGI